MGQGQSRRAPDRRLTPVQTSRAERFKILSAFVDDIGPDPGLVEKRLGPFASLLFTRFTTAWRLSYSLGTSVTPHMRAIRVFLRSSLSSAFLNELLRIGGLATLLDLIAQETDVFERDKCTAFRLIKLICSIQPACTDAFCAAGGLSLTRRALHSTLAESMQMRAIDLIRFAAERAATQYVDAQEALLLIAQPNGRAPIACKVMAIETLADLISSGQHRTLNLDRKLAHSVLQLLTIDHFKVQQQASRLLVYLTVTRPELLLTQPIISQLCRIVNHDSHLSLNATPSAPWLSNADVGLALASTSTGSHAARTLCLMVPLTVGNATYMIECGVLSGLTLMYCNVKSYEAQQVANQTLRLILAAVPDATTILERYMGVDIYTAFVGNAHGAALHRIFTDANIRRVRRAIGLLNDADNAANAADGMPGTADDGDNNAPSVVEVWTLLTASDPNPDMQKDDDDGALAGLEHGGNEDVLVGNAALNRLAVKLVTDRGDAYGADRLANNQMGQGIDASSSKNVYATIKRRALQSIEPVQLIAAMEHQRIHSPLWQDAVRRRYSVDGSDGRTRSTRKLTRKGSGSISQAVMTSLMVLRRDSLSASMKHQAANASLFLPMAIPNLSPGSVLMTQHASHNVYNQDIMIDTQSTETLLNDYNHLVKYIQSLQ